MMNNVCKNIFARYLVLMITLFLFCTIPLSLNARNRDDANYTTLLKKPNMYTGKSSWIYSYRFFPDLDGRLVDSSKIHVPEEYFMHRFQFYVGAGTGGFVCQRTEVGFKPQNTFAGGVNFVEFFTPHWGVKLGVGGVRARTIAEYDGLTDTYNITDKEGDNVRYDYSIDNVSEEQKLFQLNFPIEVLYQVKGFNLGFGMSVGVPVTVKYEQTVKNLKQSAYYPNYDILVQDSWSLGCGTYSSITNASKYSQSPIFINVMGEMEYLFSIGGKNAIGVGVFAEYSFCGITPKQLHNDQYETATHYPTATLVSISKDVPVRFLGESVLASQYASNNKRMVSNLKFLNVGLKISYCINTHPDKK